MGLSVKFSNHELVNFLKLGDFPVFNSDLPPSQARTVPRLPFKRSPPRIFSQRGKNALVYGLQALIQLQILLQ